MPARRATPILRSVLVLSLAALVVIQFAAPALVAWAGGRPAASTASPLGDDEAALADAVGHDLAAPRSVAGTDEPVGVVGPRRVDPDKQIHKARLQQG